MGYEMGYEMTSIDMDTGIDTDIDTRLYSVYVLLNHLYVVFLSPSLENLFLLPLVAKL